MASTARKNRPEMQDDKAGEHYGDLIHTLEEDIKARIADRGDIEERWEADTRQYHGRYDSTFEYELSTKKKSRIFVNITKKRTLAWEARLSDMLFPTKDKNWSIEPTPLPQMEKAANAAHRKVTKYEERMNRAQTMNNPDRVAQIEAEAQPHIDKWSELRGIVDEAKKRAELMEKLIEDQLVESKYAIHVRRAIHDACLLGTGVIKGPLISSTTSRKYEKDANHKNVWRLNPTKETKSAWSWVDPWNFFPDLSVASVGEGDGTFERHLVNKKGVRKLTNIRGFDKAAVERLLTDDPKQIVPLKNSRIRSISGMSKSQMDKLYEIWEWHGVLDKEKLEAIAVAKGNRTAGDMAKDAEYDEMTEIPVILWFCQGEVLKIGDHPLDSGATLYSLFNFEADETCPFGYGVPHSMRDSQAALNGAWRMIMDHGNVSTGPQIIYDPLQVQPVDGQRRIFGNKLWARISNKKDAGPAFEVFNIVSNHNELVRVIEMAQQFADEESNIPLIASGEQGAHTTQTKGGMAILMNASNVVFRRVVKNFDDQITEPSIQRAYEANMLHSKMQEAKGDYCIQAIGSSSLLVREMQAQNLMAMAMNFTAHPVLGPITKSANLYRMLVTAHQIPADQIVYADDEIARMAQEAAAAGNEDPEMMKIRAQMDLMKFERETLLMKAKEERITALASLAQKHNMTLDQLENKLQIADKTLQSKERILVAEAALTDRRDRRAQQMAQTGAGGKMKPQAAMNGGPAKSARVKSLPATGGGYM